MSEYLTIKQAAQRMNLTEGTILKMCVDGELSGARKRLRLPIVGYEFGQWQVLESAVDAWIAQQIEKEETEHSPRPPKLWERFRYHPWVFYPTLIIGSMGTLLLFLFAMISAGADLGGARQQFLEWGVIREFPHARNDEVLIIIASFHVTEGVANTDAHGEIRRAIEKAAIEAHTLDLRVKQSDIILETGDRSKAEALGQRYGAAVVIWGTDTGIRVEVSFLNIHEPHPHLVASEVLISETERTQIKKPDAYAEFITQDLPEQLAFLSLFAIGQSYYLKGDLFEAIEAIEAAVNSVDPAENKPEGISSAFFRLGYLYQLLPPMWNSAVSAYTTAIELNPNSAAAYLNRGVVYANTGHFNEAISDYNQAINLNPFEAIAYIDRGNAYGFMGKFEEALTDHNRGVELAPNFAGAYFSRGLTQHYLGNLDAAISDYTMAINLRADYSDAYTNRGLAYYDSNDVENAIADYTTAIDIDPHDAEAFNNRGIAKLQKGDLGGAIEDYTAAIQVDPNMAEAYYNRGAAYAEQGDIESALADYDKTIEINKEYFNVYWARSLLFRDIGELEKALGDLQYALALVPETPPEAMEVRKSLQHRIEELEREIAEKNNQ